MDNKLKYDDMPHRFNAVDLLTKVLSLKGTFYPGAMVPFLSYNNGVTVVNGLYYTLRAPEIDASGELVRQIERQAQLKLEVGTRGTPLRARDELLGRHYFMPVYLKSSLDTKEKLELPIATISIKGKKTIVETPLTGRRGSVKELISVDDYEISLHGVIMGADGNYPEDEIRKFAERYELNESMELISGLSDIVLKQDDRIVIKSIDFPEVGRFENMQVISMTAVTDSSIDLVIK